MSMDAISVVGQLRGMPPGYVNCVAVGGSSAIGDGGGGTYFWDGTSTAADNGTTVIKADNADTGRWIAVNLFNSGGVPPVSEGGTGVTSMTTYAPLFGGTTATGAIQSGTVGTSGQILTSNGAGALPTFQAAAAGGGDTTVMRTSDSANKNDNTFADDTVLLFAVSANKNYRVKTVLYVTGDTTANFKLQFTGPASPTSVAYNAFALVANPSTPTLATAFSASKIIAFPSTTLPTMVIVEMILVNGANAGTVTLQWAQQTTTGGTNTVVKAGSYIQYAQTN